MPSIDSVALSTGVRLPYVEQGDPAGVPVLMLHGYTDSWRSFELLLPHLPPRVRAIAVTQRGHGDADRPATGYRPDDFVSDAAAFMDALELPAAVLVGHSGGSYTAQRFAIEHPERTLGIALVGPFRTLYDKPELHELWQAVAEPRDPVDPGFVREFQESTATQPVPAEFMEAVIAESRKVPARVWQATLKGLLDAEACRDRHHNGADADPLGRSRRVLHPPRPGSARCCHFRRAPRGLPRHRTRRPLGAARARRSRAGRLRRDRARRRGNAFAPYRVLAPKARNTNHL
jgi:non-heme chloroperoxidase